MSYGELVPVFIFSLPRSGSTLLQRILGGHPAVATRSEPWFLLPFVSTYSHQDTYAGYDYKLALAAIEDFCAILPKGREDYLEELRSFALALYRKAAPNGEAFFLDKTPRYHHHCRTIMELFPQGKFIFLWRNPLASAASMMQSYAAGKWNLYRWKLDLYRGLEELIGAYSDRQHQVIAIRYEDLLTAPREEIEGACNYLGVDFHESILAGFKDVKLVGKFGDDGLTRYSGVLNPKPLTAWQEAYCNPARRRWAARYLTWIGPERLAVMGYEIEELRREVADAQGLVRFLLSDFGRMTYGAVFSCAEFRLYRDKFHYDWSKTYAHG